MSEETIEVLDDELQFFEEAIEEVLDDELQFYEEEIEEVYALLKRCGGDGATEDVVACNCHLTRYVAWLILDGLERAGLAERDGVFYRAKERDRA